jgi:osmoprotectant transport system permease protein
MNRRGGQVALAACSLALSLTLPFFRLSPNRMLRGEALSLVSAAPAIAFALALAWAAFAWAGRSSRGARGALGRAAAALAAFLPFAAAALASSSRAGREAGLADPASIARLSLGPGFWLALLAAFAAFLLPREPGGADWAGGIALAALGASVLGLFASGSLSALSVVKEYQSQRAVFADQLWRHLELAGIALLAGAIIGAATGAAAARFKAFRAGMFFFLNLIQTIPSLALFGFLILPLAALAARFPALRAAGIGGIGPAPALIALSLYAALPVARNFLTALELVPAAALDAGRGMGMGRAQLFLRVQLPLSLPLAVAGLRVAAVQAIGNTAVAALIGAGGLGIFIFQGLGQYAMDMVLLGTLPVIALSLAADAAFALLGRAVERGPRQAGDGGSRPARAGAA